MKICDVCGREAIYDAKILRGPWAYLCDECFDIMADKTPKLATRLKNDKMC